MVEDGSVGARSEDEGNKTSSTAELPQDESDDDDQSQHPSGDDSEVNVPSSPTQLSPIGNTNVEEWMDIIQERIMNRMKKEFVEEQEQEEETRRVRLAKSSWSGLKPTPSTSSQGLSRDEVSGVHSFAPTATPSTQQQQQHQFDRFSNEEEIDNFSFDDSSRTKSRRTENKNKNDKNDNDSNGHDNSFSPQDNNPPYPGDGGGGGGNGGGGGGDPPGPSVVVLVV